MVPRKKEMESEGEREGKICGIPEVGENSPRLREARGLRWFSQRAERTLSWKRRGAMTAYRCRVTVELRCWEQYWVLRSGVDKQDLCGRQL